MCLAALNWGRHCRFGVYGNQMQSGVIGFHDPIHGKRKTETQRLVQLSNYICFTSFFIFAAVADQKRIYDLCIFNHSY